MEDGVATLTDFTASIIGGEINLFLKKYKKSNIKLLVCGGGRKNKNSNKENKIKLIK